MPICNLPYPDVFYIVTSFTMQKKKIQTFSRLYFLDADILSLTLEFPREPW